jgi:hypothetical protein
MITFAKLCLITNIFQFILLFFFVVFEKKKFPLDGSFCFFCLLRSKTGEDGLLKLRLTFDALSILRAKRTHKGETTRIRSLSDKRIPWTKMKSTREAEKKKQNRR